MAVLDGCEKAKTTPILHEMTCEKCGEELEVFTKDSKSVEEVVCPKCGHTIHEGDHID